MVTCWCFSISIQQRNQHGLTESFLDHSQVIKSDSGLQNNVSVTPSMLPIAPNLVETELGSGVVYKSLDHLPGSADQDAPLNVQQPIFDPIERVGVPTQPLQESVSDAVNIDSRPRQPELWPGRHTTDCSVLNNIPNFQEKSRSVSISSAYSQGWASAKRLQYFSTWVVSGAIFSSLFSYDSSTSYFYWGTCMWAIFSAVVWSYNKNLLFDFFKIVKMIFHAIIIC